MLTRGDTGEATRLHRESLDLCRECGDKRGMAFALHNLGVVATHSGEYNQARDLLQEALAIRRDLRHTWGIAVTLIELGVVEREAGTRDLVVEHLREALHLASETHSLPVVLRVLGELAELLASDGDGNAAARLLTDILRHPRTDASVRERAWELLGQLGAACAEAPAAVQPDSTDEIDRHVRDILQHGWLSLSQPILT
jgi:tetratricopeptide (TPR) repeat protein